MHKKSSVLWVFCKKRLTNFDVLGVWLSDWCCFIMAAHNAARTAKTSFIPMPNFPELGVFLL